MIAKHSHHEIIKNFKSGILIGECVKCDFKRYYADSYAKESELDEIEILNGKKIPHRRRVPLGKYRSDF